MIIYPVGRTGAVFNYPYNNLIIDWNAIGAIPVTTPTYTADWTLTYQLLFGGMVIHWNDSGYFSGHAYGASNTSTGNLQFIFDGDSQTNGSVTAYNDGVINVPLITLSKVKFPIVQACKDILADVGSAGKPYKMDIIRNGVTLFTLRSIIWGTIMSTDNDPAYQMIDRQLSATSNSQL